jgi:hypothetical protein
MKLLENCKSGITKPLLFQLGTVSNSICKVLNDYTVDDKLEGMWKEVVVAQF